MLDTYACKSKKKEAESRYFQWSFVPRSEMDHFLRSPRSQSHQFEFSGLVRRLLVAILYIGADPISGLSLHKEIAQHVAIPIDIYNHRH